MAEKKAKETAEEAVEKSTKAAKAETVEKKAPAKPKAAKVEKAEKTPAKTTKAAKAVKETTEKVEKPKKAPAKAAEKVEAEQVAEKPAKKAKKVSGNATEKQAKAIVRTIRIAPRKTRLVLDLIRGKQVGEAIAILRYTPKASSPVIEKVLNSAVANAEHNYEMDVTKLYVAEAFADEGPTLKRFRPRAQGRASAINKRTSHITIVVKEK